MRLRSFAAWRFSCWRRRPSSRSHRPAVDHPLRRRLAGDDDLPRTTPRSRRRAATSAQFPAQVKDGVLVGEIGDAERPGLAAHRGPDRRRRQAPCSTRTAAPATRTTRSSTRRRRRRTRTTSRHDSTAAHGTGRRLEQRVCNFDFAAAERASGHDLVVQVLRVLRLREEEPAIGEQARHLQRAAPATHAEAGSAPAADHGAAATAGSAKREHDRDASLMRRSAARDARWKNSRVLNEPADMPIDFCASRGERMPVADCSVERWRSAALRRSASACATPRRRAVTTSAQRRRRARAAAASPASAASALASTSPDDRPSSDEVDDRERLRPFLDEAQARVDHRRAVPEQRGDGDRGERQRRGAPASTQLRAAAEPPQRDQGDEGRQHDHLARQPGGAPHHRGAPGALRAGRGGGTTTPRPTTSRTIATRERRGDEARSQRHAGQDARARARRRGPAPAPASGGEEDDRERRIHARASRVAGARPRALRLAPSLRRRPR